MISKVESGHGLLYLSQIVEPQVESNVPGSSIEAISRSLNDWKFNFALPIVCLTDKEERYRLLTGLPIYEAAKKVGLKQIWVFLVAAQQVDAEKVIEEAQVQSKFNTRLVESADWEEFRDFLNDTKSPLTSISGIKDGYARLIRDKRPYRTLEDMKKLLGPKRCLNWLKAYKNSSFKS